MNRKLVYTHQTLENVKISLLTSRDTVLRVSEVSSDSKIPQENGQI